MAKDGELIEQPAAVQMAAPEAAPARAPTPMEMIAQALQKSGDLAGNIELAAKMIDLAERIEAKQAEKAFFVALRAAKAEIEPIRKSKPGAFSNYAPVGVMAKAVDPILSRHGLSYTWPIIEIDGSNLLVTCEVAHESGFRRETTFPAAIEKTNAIDLTQARGKAATYGRRYSLEAALGLTTIDRDLDGRGDGAVAETKMISGAYAQEIQGLATKLNALERLLDAYKVDSVADLTAEQGEWALAKLRETEVAREAKAEASA